MLVRHTPASSILVIVPQQTLAGPYRELLQDPTLPGAGTVDILTLNGLALRTIQLFWPAVAAQAGFARPFHPPVFLNIETTQYFLHQAIDPLSQTGLLRPQRGPGDHHPPPADEPNFGQSEQGCPARLAPRPGWGAAGRPHWL